MRLTRDVAGMKEVNHKVLEAIQEVLEVVKADKNSPDNYDMSPEQIKDLILAKYDLSKLTYPSDIAFDHGLDYDAVLKAVELLRKEGRAEYVKQ